MDITERKHAEEATRASERQLRRVLDSLFAFVGVMTLDGVLIEANRSALKAAGVEATDVLGKRFEETYWFAWSPEVQSELREAIRKAAAGEVSRYDVVVRLAQGRLRPIDFMLAPMYDEDGHITHLVPSAIDITDRKRTEELLRKANAELARKNAEIEQLLYTASHDLKSPLVTIQGFLGHLGDDAKAGRLDRMLDHSQRVQNAASRMARLLDDLLNFSRVGRVEKEPVSINLSELVHEVVSVHAQELASTKISVEIQEHMPVIIGEKDRFHQVFDNLLVNAIKYGSGADMPLIEIGAHQENDETLIFVKDNGKGIAPEYHKRVFDLFHSLEQDKGSSGVGLAIVKRVVEVHGGRVWVESTPGEGATFWLSFPAAKERGGNGVAVDETSQT